MELNEGLDLLANELVTEKNKGHAGVDIEALQAYIAGLRKHAALSVEAQKMQHLSNLEGYRAQSASALEMFRSVISAGKEAINAVIVVNGGAVVALLAFLGNAVGKGNLSVAPFFASALGYFGWGVFFGAVSFAGRYLAQFLYAAQGYVSKGAKGIRIAGHLVNAATWLATVLALFLFVSGALHTETALRDLPSLGKAASKEIIRISPQSSKPPLPARP